MNTLIVEDVFACRKFLQTVLGQFGPCDVAVNGNEAMIAFQDSLNDNKPYDLVCLDIMMPSMNGHETLSEIRRIEALNGIHGLDGVKVIMTTALDDSKNIMQSFREGCEAYVIKPISRETLLKQVQTLGLIKDQFHQKIAAMESQ